MYVDRFSSTNPEDWTEEFQAGCRLWVNNSTGEVTTECPWESSSSSTNMSIASSSSSTTTTKKEMESEETYATGHLVYEDDGEGISDILDYLDKIDAASKK